MSSPSHHIDVGDMHSLPCLLSTDDMLNDEIFEYSGTSKTSPVKNERAESLAKKAFLFVSSLP